MDRVKTLRAIGGDDCPEYAFDAILEVLRTNVPPSRSGGANIGLLFPGSQIVVLTDADTKNPAKEAEIIREATTRRVCIHFIFDPQCCCGLAPDRYQRIAAATGGTVVNTLSDANAKATLDEFIAKYKTNKCGFVQANEQRRQTAVQDYSDYAACHTLQVPFLSTYLTMTVNTDQPEVAVTRPDGAEIKIDVTDGYGTFGKPNPEVGEWKACVAFGTFKYQANYHINMDISISFLDESSTELFSDPPAACKFFLFPAQSFS